MFEYLSEKLNFRFHHRLSEQRALEPLYVICWILLTISQDEISYSCTSYMLFGLQGLSFSFWKSRSWSRMGGFQTKIQQKLRTWWWRTGIKFRGTLFPFFLMFSIFFLKPFLPISSWKWKIAKMALLNLCMKFKNIFGQKICAGKSLARSSKSRWTFLWPYASVSSALCYYDGENDNFSLGRR